MKWKSYEDKWQKRWQESEIFVPKVNRDLKKFFMTIPYPYTSGALHIGHGRTYTLGDVLVRFKRHQGFNVLFPMAFHISGSPILSISDKIKREHARTLSLYRSYLRIYENNEAKIEQILKSFEDPENVANYFANKIQSDFESIGYSIDWTRKFNTGQPRYNKFVEWQFKQLNDKGILVKGKHPILWSVEESHPVGEDDIADGDVDKVTVSEFSGIKFKSDFGYFIASTLRPETVFGVTNLWLNSNKYYVVADVDDERWIVSEKAIEKIKLQKKKVKVVKREKGNYYIGGKVMTPDGREIPILPADFVNQHNATGVVYSVPAHAPYDYMALHDLRHHAKWGEIVREIEPIVVIKIPGQEIPAKEICERMEIRNQTDSQLEEATKELYKTEFYSGILNEKCKQFANIPVHNAKEQISEWLIGEKLSTPIYETSRLAITRSGGKVAVAVLDNQWFIDYSDEKWKTKTIEHLKKMLIFPEKFRKLFIDTVNWLDKRPCARKRGLGTKFPLDKKQVIESLSDSTIYMAYYTVIPYLQKINPENLDADVFDYLLLGKGEVSTIAKKTGRSEEELEAARGEFEYWYPNDQRHTAPSHISNHLTFFIMHHIAIFPEKDWPQGISLNDMLVREGAKMSKSKGNIIPLNHVKEKYGADLYRLYVTSSADMETVVDWKEKEVSSVQRKLEKFIDIIENCEKVNERVAKTEIEKWMISKFNRSLESATKLMTEFNFREAIVEIFFKVLNDIRWFERRSENIYGVVKAFAKDWLVAMAPIIPHTAEEYWEKLGGKGFVSVANWPKVDKKLIDDSVEANEIFIQGVMEDIRNMIKMSEKIPKKIYLYTAKTWKNDAFKLVIEKKGDAMKKAGSFKNPKEAAKVLSSFVKNRIWETPRELLNESELIKSAKQILKSEFNAEVEVNNKHDPMKKSSKAMPFRPAIYLE